MPPGRRKFLPSTIVSLLIFATFASSDDGDYMAQLAESISPTPDGWTGPNFCKWNGVVCNTPNKVSSINLASRSLTGTLPPGINQLSELRSLSLQRNRFSGKLPDLSNHGSLEEVILDDNAFSSIPTGFLSGLTRLRTFSMNNNVNLPAWTLPATLQDSWSLVSFSVSKSNVVGSIPYFFGTLPNFESLRLSYNNMTGWLPWSFAKSGIRSLVLNNQMVGFSGPIEVLGDMYNLKEAWLQVNQFSGYIPDLSKCTELSDLQLRENQLTGPIPDSLTKLPKLQNVALQNNVFQGPMPSFRSGVQVNLGNNNHFCLPSPGPCNYQVTVMLEIAASMYYPMELARSWQGNDACQQWQYVSCQKGNVVVVNFAKQNFTGIISPSYGKLPRLKSLYLNDNMLVGVVPRSLTKLKQLQVLDISNNNISGKFPSFHGTVELKVRGNPFIGKDVPITYPAGRPPPGVEEEKVDSSLPTWKIVVIVLTCLIFLGLGYFLCKCCCFIKPANEHKKFHKLGRDGSISDYGKSMNSIDYNVYDMGNIIIPIEVLRKATDNFSEKSILGKGGFGIVYRGELSDGTKLAVKRMEASMISGKGLHEFKAEIEVLTSVRHRNLVSLHGWNQRVSIALDVARGVEYLHSMANQSFIHRDLKPTNILLGDDMRAKVCDFGLVRQAPDANCSVETRLAGTFGYLAPEYAATGRVTTKVDVYAFGVILMELVTGRKSLDNSMPEESSNLVTWFRPLLQDKDRIREALDPTLRSDLNEEIFEGMWKVAQLAGHCTREANKRPDMSHSVTVLSPLVEQWKPALVEDSFIIDFSMSLRQVLHKWKNNEDSSAIATDYINQKR